MHYCRAINNLIHKPKISLHNWKLVVSRGLQLSISVLPKVDHYNQINKSKLVQPYIQLGKKPNFSTTVTARAYNEGPNQRKERMKNYITIGAIIIFLISVFYFYQTMEFSHDRVYVGSSEQNK